MTEVMIFSYLRLEMILYVCCGSVHQPLPCQEWEQHMHQSYLELIIEIDSDRIKRFIFPKYYRPLISGLL